MSVWLNENLVVDHAVLEDYYDLKLPAAQRRPVPPRGPIQLQAHGSVYGMIAAARGDQQPIGEWNFQEVTIQGSRARVELNGTVILDADVSTVDLSAVMGQRPHPGKDRLRGFFGFAGRCPVPGRKRKEKRTVKDFENTLT